MVRALEEELVKPLQKNQKSEIDEIAQFEVGYKKARDDCSKEIKRLEEQSKKAGKKNPGELQKVMTDLSQKNQRS